MEGLRGSLVKLFSFMGNSVVLLYTVEPDYALCITFVGLITIYGGWENKRLAYVTYDKSSFLGINCIPFSAHAV